MTSHPLLKHKRQGKKCSAVCWHCCRWSRPLTQVELLVHKVVALKKSRDKLLEQLDGQSVEMEQLMADNQVCH